MHVSREIKVGLLAVGAMLMLFFGFNFLKGSDFFSSTKKYTATYASIDGLTTSNPVRINGLTVGRVKSIDILQDQGNKLRVTLELEKNIRVTQGSRAVLGDDGLLGGKVIQLVIKNGMPLLEDGGQLVADSEKGLTTLVREKTIPVLDNVDSLTYQLNRIVKQFDQTGIVLNRTLGSANAALGTLDLTIAENRVGLRSTLANVNRLSASLIETERQLKPILAKADNFVDSLQGLQLKQTLATVNKTVGNLQGILASIDRGEGSIGKLNTDASFYRNVNATTMSLERLLRDFRENPKRYVHFSLFGRKEKKLPNEADTLYIATPEELTITAPAAKADSTQ